MQHSSDPRAAAPPSPCINVCVLDGAGLCLGCLRTGDEIGRWRHLSAPEQWRLLDRLEERRNLRIGGPASPPPTPPSEESR
ncbi:MAG: DUF1289 domain-containing protein [Gammaproteobacteria bacterium]